MITIEVPKHSRKRRHRVGRGESSGSGRCAGRGNKGQQSRTGSGPYVGHEGGQLPLYRKVPKVRGYASYQISRQATAAITLSDIDKYFQPNAEVSLEALQAKKLVSRRCAVVKILSRGKLSKALQFKGIKASESAKAAIVAAGGQLH